MPRKSSIELLPKSILEQVNGLIRDGVTIDDIVETLQEVGHARSRTAVGRHHKKVMFMQRKVRQSREMAEALAPSLGEATLAGKQGRMLVELTRQLCFDVLDTLYGEDGEVKSDITSKDIQQLGKGIAELARAQRMDQDFENKIREQVQDEARKQAAEDATAVAIENGLSGAIIETIKSSILGVKAGE